jgi:putative acetyltransferase
MIIRRYQSGEEEILWKLYYDTTHKIVSQSYTKDQVNRWAPQDKDMNEWRQRIKDRNPFVAEENGEILGFAELEQDGHIDMFYCHWLYQRKGIGFKLFNAIEKEAYKMGIERLYAEVSLNAKDFFLSCGFYIDEERNNMVSGAPAKQFIMKKEL